MLNQIDLRELLDYQGTNPILSIYLNTEPSLGNADVYKLRLRNMLKKIDAPEDIQMVERYFDHEYDWSGRSVVIFSCASENLFRAYPIEIPLQDLVYHGNQPSLKPLTALLKSYGGYGVILIDKRDARIFSFDLGELRKQKEFSGEAVRQTKRGGSSAVHGQRGGTAGLTGYVDEIIERNMKNAVELAVKFFKDCDVERILIGGSDENISLFTNQLPKAWKKLVAGTFSISMNASTADIIKNVIEAGNNYQDKRTTKLVKELITAAAKGENAVTGLEETISAINDKKVDTLVVSEDFQKPGYTCPSCGIISMENIQECIICKGEGKPVPDIVELAVGSVIKFGGDVEVIQNNPALQEAGQIAAALRF